MKHPKAPPRPTPPARKSGNTLLLVSSLTLVAALAYVFVSGGPAQPEPQSAAKGPDALAPAAVPVAREAADTAQVTAAAPPTTPPKPGAKGALPPLPVNDYPALRSPQVVQAVYEFAARRPEVLQYVPCFCGCERYGHQGNDDCFVASRDAEGNVTWDAHGMG